jgi:cytochrome c peroxidase
MKKYIIIIMGVVAVVLIQATTIKNNPVSKEKIGELLFSDPILSKDSTVSCASCHRPGFAFADTSAVSIGVKEKKGVRNKKFGIE